MSIADVAGNNENAVSNYHASHGNAAKQTDVQQSLAETFSHLVQEKREELYEKIKNGETEPRYPIGAGSYTEKEWERHIKSFDKIQEMIRKEAGLEDKRKTSKTGNKATGIDEEIMGTVDASLLFAECICCTNPPVQEEEEEEFYLIVYDKGAVYCIKEGSQGYVWKIKLCDESQYFKVEGFVNSLDSKENYPFVSSEDFWKDFLDDKIDMEQFMQDHLSA